MEIKKFATLTEAQEFVLPLHEEKKWVIDIKELPEGMGYSVEWQPHKTYKAIDGKEFPDEIWVTADGRVMLIQDMSEDHVRNTLRMLIRNRRVFEETFGNIIDQLTGIMDELPDDEEESADPFEGKFTIKAPTTLQ